ncbi:PASTA domain-containing protein [Halopseudomonas salina]|uniref:PASTA domain-containing protein n=1 Tax=Halopseudomonas salina TaxID=1323744 RepID=A0ABQ1PCZ2_9GAMM|nr:PASTA domain-containing protein [Halopseudomonas salina]GGC94821.1 hypothetical protein GCM10007418_13020 [Halopseudomonas salina]
MQWSITGVVLEADGKPATGTVQVQIYDLTRKAWRAQAKAALNAQGRFSLKTKLTSGGEILPAMRLCEASVSGQPARVLAEGGLVQVASATSAHLSFGQIQRLANNAIARSDHTAPFSQTDDYLIAGVPRPPAPQVSAATARMTMAGAPITAFVKPQIVEQPSTAQLRMNADLTKRIELQDTELNQKQMQMVQLEQNNLKTTQELRLAQSRIATLERELKAKPATTASSKPVNEQFTLATETMKLNLNEQIIRQAADYDIRAMQLQQTINAKNLELTSYTERLKEMAKVSSAAMEEAAKAKDEAEQLKQQMNTQVGAGELYANIGKQLQEAQMALNNEAVPYRLGKVSLNLKTLVSGNQLTMPTLADLNNKGAAGMFTDVNLEFLPDAAVSEDEGLISVPDFTELTETLARRLARDMGLNMDAAYQSVTNSSLPIGQAIRQLPAKGTQVSPGESIMVVFTQA